MGKTFSVTFISTWTKKERDEKGRSGLEERGTLGNQLGLPRGASFTITRPPETNATPHSVVFPKAASLFHGLNLDDSKKYALNVVQEKLTSGHSSMIHSLSFLLSLKWLKPMLSNRLGRGTQKPWPTSWTTWAPRRLNKAQKNAYFLRWHSLGTQDWKESFFLFSARLYVKM